MGNHYHLLIETPDGNLSIGMRQLNGVFTQRFNRRHKHTGHIFQGRYKSILVGLQKIRNEARLLDEVPKVERRQVEKSLQQFRNEYPDRDRAMAAAYLSGSYTMKEIGAFFGVHYPRKSSWKCVQSVRC